MLVSQLEPQTLYLVSYRAFLPFDFGGCARFWCFAIAAGVFLRMFVSKGA